MGRFGFVGASYTARSIAVADEECINWYAELIESQGSLVSSKSYGGANALSVQSYFPTPGIAAFSNTAGAASVRGLIFAGGRLFEVVGAQFVEITNGGAQTVRGAVANDGNQASLAQNGLQVLIVSGGEAYCFTLATNVLLNVTGQLAGAPLQCDESDTYFVVIFEGSNKFQMSQVLDGTTWPGQLVNEVSVFPDNITAIKINHRELWVMGQFRSQPYQDTGSAEIYDVIPGALIENGCAATFAISRADNSVFWLGQDERGGRMCWRSNGYTPQRISTHAVEYDLGTYTAAQIAAATVYSYQDGGHIFWVIYIPGASWTWVFDISQGLWHKRDQWNNGQPKAHWGWNYVYAFGMHLIGDWNSGNLYAMELTNLTDLGGTIRRLRRAPTVGDEMKIMFHQRLTIDFETGLGPIPPLLDGAGNARDPQCMLRFSDDRGHTWSNQLLLNCGQAGNFLARATQTRLGSSRYRVYEVACTDPIAWTIVDAYLATTASSGLN